MVAKKLTAVDLFAGAGGNSVGATQAGVRVIRAANHWPVAVECHTLNHPETKHDCQDLQQANFYEWDDFDIMLASPACQGHTSARGVDRPHHDATRSTAWAVIACAEAKRPKYLMVENVVDFGRWQLFGQWRSCLEILGYTLHLNVLNSADFGVPQARKRLFVTGVHRSVSTRPVVVTPPMTPHKPAESIIDWDAEGRWSKVLERVPATVKRWEKGRLDHGDQFLMAYFGKEAGGRSLSKPLGTVLTKDRYALVRGDMMRMLNIEEYRRAMGFPADYRLPGTHKHALHLLGNAVVPAVTKGVVETFIDHLAAA